MRRLEKPGREVSGRDRERTKRLVYAGLYGAGARTLADILQLPQGQLEEVIHGFDSTDTRYETFPREGPNNLFQSYTLSFSSKFLTMSIRTIKQNMTE